LQDLAGTGRDRFDVFAQQVDTFHADWRGFFVPKIYQKEKIRSADLDNLPQFWFVEESTQYVWGRAGIDLAGVLILTALLGRWGFGALRRYPITG
jgi:ABC-2 type transport system permease protein